MVNDINFPVICFSQNLIFVIMDRDDFTTCSMTGLKKGFYKGLSLVDAKGKGYKLRDAEKTGNAGTFWGFSLKYGRRVKVNPIFEHGPHPVSLNELKQRICSAIDRNSEVWSAGGDIEELKDAVKRSTNYDEIIRPFLE